MPPAVPDPSSEIVKYLMVVMKHSELKPDYHKVAAEANISNANNA